MSWLIVYFFFFKQKTAYELRISDWSSDVCSSDLGRREEDDERGQDQEETDAHQVLDRVVRMERDAVGRLGRVPAVALRALLDVDAVGVVGTHFMQRAQVQHHQQQQHQRQRDHVQGEEAVERRGGGQVGAHENG